MTDDIDRRHLDAIADADQFPYWFDDVDEPDLDPDADDVEGAAATPIPSGDVDADPGELVAEVERFLRDRDGNG